MKKSAKAAAEKPAKTPSEKVVKAYLGAPIEASRLFRRDMPQFKNCKAEVFLAVNDDAGTTTYMNVYNSVLPLSYNPATYTYPIKNEKALAKKLESMIEVEDREKWPSFVVSAGVKVVRSRRKKG